MHLTAFLFGPYSTGENFGYESNAQISPIIPTSYTTWRAPKMVGVQFIGDAPANLRADHFSLSITGPKGPVTGLKADYQVSGFIGYKLPRLTYGTYHVVFYTPLFKRSKSSWTLSIVKPKVPLVAVHETASDRISLDTLNAYRSLLNEPPVTWSSTLADAAMAHAQYLKVNGYGAPSFHMESPGRTDFTARTPWGRDLRYGWQSALDGEVGIEWTNPLPPVAVVQDLMDTVFHRLSLLSGNLLKSGEGSSAGNTGAVVMDLGYGYSAKLPLAVPYPRPGETGVPTAWIDLESPDPVPHGFGHRYGYPITIDFPTIESFRSVQFGLFLGHRRVPVYLDHPGINSLSDNQIAMVPKLRLFPDTVYSVSVQAQALFNSGAIRPVNLHWSFETGGGSESLAVAPMSSHQAVVSVVRAGGGNPIIATTVRLYRVTASGRLELQTVGHTNSRGEWIASRQNVLKHALYQVTSATGNSQQFWW